MKDSFWKHQPNDIFKINGRDFFVRNRDIFSLTYELYNSKESLLLTFLKEDLESGNFSAPRQAIRFTKEKYES
jgi:hypothetical protein